MSLLVESLLLLLFRSSVCCIVTWKLQMDSTFANLSINHEEEVELLLDEVEGSEGGGPNDLCLVGRFITQQTVSVPSMKNTLSTIWRPMRGVSIKPIGEGRFLFQFYHVLDVKRILNGSP
ncbi:hypothetical protein ACS0TY_034541 [Phlomoides rotata]